MHAYLWTNALRKKWNTWLKKCYIIEVLTLALLFNPFCSKNLILVSPNFFMWKSEEVPSEMQFFKG